MPVVPLATKAYRRTAAFLPETRCVNMYLEKDQSGVSPDQTIRIQRPGLSPSTILPSAIRGVFAQDGVFGGTQFAVAGTKLYSLPSTLLGDVGGTGPVAFSTHIGPDGTPVLDVLSDQSIFTWDGSALAPLAMPDPDYADVVDIDTLNGYLLIATGSGRFYWLVPGATAIDGLDFATAESAADGLVGVRRLVDEFGLFGASSVEVWQTTGDPDAPFNRAAGRQFDRGCVSRDTIQRFDNSILWVGDDLSIYRFSSVPGDQGDPSMSERLRLATGDPSAWVFGIDDHKFYVLKIPGQGTFSFDAATQQWSEFASEGYPEWRCHVGTQIGSEIIAGDSQSGKIWVLEPGLDDDGTLIRRTISGTVALSGRPVRNDSFSIGIGSSEDCTVNVRWRDGLDAFPDTWEALDARAPIDVANLYRLGQANEPFRTFEVEMTDPAIISIFGAKANEAYN
jgi:hypothetical protein